ncbi:hypothetical protein AB0I98_21095 [Streptomyces sp. NPDC050211]
MNALPGTAHAEISSYVAGGCNVVVLLCWGLLVGIALVGTRLK